MRWFATHLHRIDVSVSAALNSVVQPDTRPYAESYFVEAECEAEVPRVLRGDLGIDVSDPILFVQPECYWLQEVGLVDLRLWKINDRISRLY